MTAEHIWIYILSIFVVLHYGFNFIVMARAFIKPTILLSVNWQMTNLHKFLKLEFYLVRFFFTVLSIDIWSMLFYFFSNIKFNNTLKLTKDEK